MLKLVIYRVFFKDELHLNSTAAFIILLQTLISHSTTSYLKFCCKLSKFDGASQLCIRVAPTVKAECPNY
jgi:hypothetical protein